MTKCMMALLTMLATAGSAVAQDAATGRYSMQRSETGIARLDTETGEVSLCREKDGQMVCRMAADERTAYDLELDLLEKRVETLEKAVSNRQEPPKSLLPTQEEIDRSLGLMERMMRSFMGIVRDFDGGEKTPPEMPETEPRKT